MISPLKYMMMYQGENNGSCRRYERIYRFKTMCKILQMLELWLKHAALFACSCVAVGSVAVCLIPVL